MGAGLEFEKPRIRSVGFIDMAGRFLGDGAVGDDESFETGAGIGIVFNGGEGLIEKLVGAGPVPIAEGNSALPVEANGACAAVGAGVGGGLKVQGFGIVRLALGKGNVGEHVQGGSKVRSSGGLPSGIAGTEGNLLGVRQLLVEQIDARQFVED